MTYDNIDREICNVLEKDPCATLATIAIAVHLTTTPTWKRVRRLETHGVIKRRVEIDRSKFSDQPTTQEPPMT